MKDREEDAWQMLRNQFAALRDANAQAQVDVGGSRYDTKLSMEQFADESHRFIDCETRIVEALASRTALTWWIKRWFLGKHCRDVHTWFDRSTDDNFDWTRQAQAIRTSRDEVARCLRALGF